MPIVISRETGAVKEAPTYTQEQLDNAWEQGGCQQGRPPASGG